jgi:hypothetical protein
VLNKKSRALRQQPRPPPPPNKGKTMEKKPRKRDDEEGMPMDVSTAKAILQRFRRPANKKAGRCANSPGHFTNQFNKRI